MTLFHLELGDAVAQETADAIGSFVHDHLVPGTGELLGSCEARGARADHGDLLACLGGCGHRHDPTLGEGAVNNLDFDALDRDGRLVNAENTRRLTRRRAERPVNSGKLLVACNRSIASCHRPR